MGWGGALIAPIRLAPLSRLQHHLETVPENGQVIPLPWGIRPTPPANISRLDAQPHLIPQPTLFKFVAPKRLRIAHCDPEVGSVDRKQAVVSDVSHLPVIKLNLMSSTKTCQFNERSESMKSNNQTNNAHHSPLFRSTQKVTG